MLGKIFMLLLVALGIAMAVPSTRAQLEEKAAPVLNNFRGKLVPSRLEAMADQLETRANRGEGFPANFNGWLERSFSGAPGHTGAPTGSTSASAARCRVATCASSWRAVGSRGSRL